MNKKSERKIIFAEGFRDGIPIGLGYFAVSFSLGIVARNIGLTPFQSFLVSLLCNASAGEYAGFTVIAAQASMLEMAVIILVANARYLLMSCALSQRMRPEMKLYHRLFIGYDVTDEIFGITIARPGFVEPFYVYGAIAVAAPSWAIGTMVGNLAGNILPSAIVAALSVALYGMFIAIIIPPAKKDKVIGALIAISFALSFAASRIPIFAGTSEGTRTIVLTVAISTVAALCFPREEEAQAC